MQTYINTQYCNAGSKKKRYGVRLTVVQNSQSVSNNTSNITVTFELGGAGALGLSTDYTGSSFNGYTCYGTIYVNGSEKASGSSSATIKNNTKVTLASWTGNVSHNNDGTLSIPIRGVFTGGTSTQASGGEASGTVTFDTIPRASSVTCTTANVGAKPTFTISRASSGFTHTLKYSFGSLSGTIATGVGTSYSNWTIPTSFYAQIPNSTSGTGTITCDTYNGSTYIGSKTCSFTVTVPNTAKPNVSNPTIVDTDTISKDTIQLYVVSKSKLKFTFPTFSTSYGSTLKNYTLKINGTQVYSGTDSSYTMGSPISTASNKYELIITDSRSISNTTGEISFTAYAYSAPTCSITAERNSTTPTTVNITYSGTITNINSNNKNAKSFKIEYKQSTASSWTTITTVTDAYTKTNIALSRTSVDDSHSFDFRITATDSYGNATATAQIGTSATLINFSADGTAIAFGKASESSNTFECALDANFTGNVNQIGDLSSLNTTAKTDTVSAINELVTNITGIKTNKILWQGSSYMNEAQEYTFSDNVQNQPNGIVLIWSAYNNGAAANWNWTFTFVPKYWVANHNGNGVTCTMFGSSFSTAGCKYVYVTDTTIRGNAANTQRGTASGITYYNDLYVLRYVVGV
jgi:hypothetical protein